MPQSSASLTLRLHCQVNLERKITASLRTAQDAPPTTSTHPYERQGLSYPSPAPSLPDEAPTPPLSHSPLDSNLSYASFDAPLLYPSINTFFAYPPQLYYPPPLPEPQPRSEKDTYGDVSQWAFDVAAPFVSYDYPFVAPHDVGGEPHVVGWEQPCGVQNDWQQGLGIGMFEVDTGTSWSDWNV